MRWLAVALLVACGGGGGGTSKVAHPKQDAVDEKQAEKDARGLVTEVYATLGRGTKDSLFSLLDASLVVFGPRKSDALGSRTETLVALGTVINPKDKLAVRSSSLEVVASPGGRSAWAFDLVTIAGEPHAMLAILINTDDMWQVEAAVIAQTPSRGTVRSELARDAIVPPGASAKAKLDSTAKGAVDRFHKGLLDQDVWGADLGSRSDALYVGPSIGEVTRGKKELKKLWKKRSEAKLREAESGDLVAGATPDGQLAWVSAPVTRVDDDAPEPLPLRAFAVFERAGDGWKLIALHESLAIDEPGAGAPFRKLAPPKEPEKKIEAADDKPAKAAHVKKKKKKTKKKKKPVADDE
ncbi:MAG: SnoaL-like domain [Deltaproteobacteria bacterium]|nr:SnoaL-like domain [Deltaproteobacteria bacterium]